MNAQSAFNLFVRVVVSTVIIPVAYAGGRICCHHLTDLTIPDLYSTCLLVMQLMCTFYNLFYQRPIINARCNFIKLRSEMKNDSELQWQQFARDM